MISFIGYWAVTCAAAGGCVLRCALRLCVAVMMCGSSCLSPRAPRFWHVNYCSHEEDKDRAAYGGVS